MITEALLDMILAVIGGLMRAVIDVITRFDGLGFAIPLPRILFDYAQFVITDFALASPLLTAWWVWRQIKS